MAENAPGDLPEIPLGDVLGDVPLFREIQRVLLSSSGPINWELARQVGIAVATHGLPDPTPDEGDREALEKTARAAELAVASFSGLPSPHDVTAVVPVRRSQWVEKSIAGLTAYLEPLGEKLALAMSQAQAGDAGPDLAAAADENPLLQMLTQKMVPLLFGMQMGSTLGAVGQRVLSGYDIPIPRPGGSLIFVVPNITSFERDWGIEPREFGAWVAIHEVTHRLAFSGAWTEGHVRHLVTDLAEHAEIDLSDLQSRIEGMDVADPEAMAQAFEGVGDIFGRSSDPEQRLRIARVQAFLAVAEGYGDHVVERVSRSMLHESSRIEEALVRHREGRHSERALDQLIGLETPPERYRLGVEFCERVAGETDEPTLARIWESPDSLPSIPELEEPALWLSRMA